MKCPLASHVASALHAPAHLLSRSFEAVSLHWNLLSFYNYTDMKAKARTDVPTGPPLSQEQCLLFELPPEIRNYIYELALDVATNDSGEVVLKRRLDGNRRTVLDLLGVCRLIHQEAAGSSPSSRGIFEAYDSQLLIELLPNG